MPELSFANVDFNKAAADVNNAIKDAAYIAVGLGILGFQRAQVQRVELTKQLEQQLRSLNTPIEGYTAFAKEQAATARVLVTEQMSELSRSVEEALAPVREQLAKVVPGDWAELPSLPDLGEQIESQWEAVKSQLNGLAKAVDERVAPARATLHDQFDQIEERLPGTARDLFHSVREAASTQEQAFRSVVGLG